MTFEQAQANWDNMEPPEPADENEDIVVTCFYCGRELEIGEDEIFYENCDGGDRYASCKKCHDWNQS